MDPHTSVYLDFLQHPQEACLFFSDIFLLSEIVSFFNKKLFFIVNSFVSVTNGFIISQLLMAMCIIVIQFSLSYYRNTQIPLRNAGLPS